jgi:hypothetical protein
MLIFATLGINVVAIAIWSIKNQANGFAEIPKLLRGEPAFVPTVKGIQLSGEKPAAEQGQTKNPDIPLTRNPDKTQTRNPDRVYGEN